MLFKATFNNISDILWKSVLLVEGTEVHIENYQPAAVSQWQIFLMMLYLILLTRQESKATLLVISIDYINRCKSNHHR